MSEDLGRLIRCRMRELELDPATFVFNRFGGENITRTYDYLKAGVSPVWWTSPIFGPKEDVSCHSLVGRIRLSSASRWSSWREPGGPPRS